MRSRSIVKGEPAGQGAPASLIAAIEPSVGPFLDQRLDEAFGFAIGLRAVGPRTARLRPDLLQGPSEAAGAVGAPLIGQYAFDSNAQLGEMRRRGEDKGRRRLVTLVVVDLH